MLALSVLGAANMAMAQDATPDATPLPPTDGYPVGIHQGSCSEPVAQPAWQLDNALTFGISDNDDPNVVGMEVSTTVYETSGTIDFQIDDLANDGHAVAVHASSDEFGTIVACGDIAGIQDNGQIVVPLVPVDGGTMVGIAIVDADEAGFFDLGDDQTQLTIYVFDSAPMS